MFPTPSFRPHPATLFSRERRKQRLEAFLDAFNRQTQSVMDGMTQTSVRGQPTRSSRQSAANTGGR
jgi:hypothetical protein